MDKLLLQYEIKKNGYTTETFCKAIGMSKAVYYSRCRGETDFTRSEIAKIVEVLHLDGPVEIFFPNLVN